MQYLRQRIKLYAKLVFLIPLLFTSCEKDEEIYSETENQRKTLDITAVYVQGDIIRSQNKNLDLFLKTRFEEKNSLQSENSNAYNFTIVTDQIIQLTGINYINYIFKVTREIPLSDGFENYMLTMFDDGSYMQVLLYYPVIENNGNLEVDIQAAHVTYINDQTLLTGIETSPCGNANQEIIAWEEECVAVNCGDVGNHSPGEACNNGEYVAYWNCTGGWVVTDCVYTGGGNGSSPSGSGGTTNDPSNATTNGGNATTPVNTDETVVTIPNIPSWEEIADCLTVKNFLDNNHNYELVLKDLKNHTNANFERALIKFSNINTIGIQNGTPQQPQVRLPSLPAGTNVEALAHSHYEDPNTSEPDTYSIFSMDDLKVVAQLLTTQHADDTFVAFLATGKETYYAMTINDTDKFLDFMFYKVNENNIPTNPADLLKWSHSKENFKNVNKKFYEKDTAPIKVSNTDNRQVLRAFVQMLQEADMGITLFQSNEDFSIFTKVSYDATAVGNIKETPCGN